MGSQHQRKLCGFLRLIVSARSQASENPQNHRFPSPGVSCCLSCEKAKIFFISDDGFILSPIEDNKEGDSNHEEPESSNPHKQKKKKFSSSASSYLSRKRRRKGRTTTAANSTFRRKKEIVGGGKVVNQLQALTNQRCVFIESRVIGVSLRGEDSVRAVVLVDVYLPIGAWCGWQFPRSGSMAASLFRHLSCDWEMRNSLLEFQSSENLSHKDDESVWDNSDCNVLGCTLHRRNLDDYGKKKSFDLHEIFKTLPSVVGEDSFYSKKINPDNDSINTWIWDLADDVLSNILSLLGPRDLISVASTCCHLRSLAASVMPCMDLKLFPHQQAAVRWMLKRERNSDALHHPLYMNFSSQDGFHLYMNVFSGYITTDIAPTVKDFNGGLFCDEPGLGKTITALSLILKTYGTLAGPPRGADVVWCAHDSVKKCGYYEVSADDFINGTSAVCKIFTTNARRRHRHGDISNSSLELPRSDSPDSVEKCSQSNWSDLSDKRLKLEDSYSTTPRSLRKTEVSRKARDLSCVRRNLLDMYGGIQYVAPDEKIVDTGTAYSNKHANYHLSGNKQRKKSTLCTDSASNVSWVQCDACRKWRKLPESTLPDATVAWFCSMNSNPIYKSCTDPEESWDRTETITYIPGFHIKGTSEGTEDNVSFFTSVLREHSTLIHSETRKALDWLANLSESKLLEMETSGLTRPVLDSHSRRDADEYHKIFQALGLVKRIERGTARWYYPQKLENLVFDVKALRIALTKPVDLFRFYLSRATLVVVPANLVEHWKTQVQRHVQPGQLRVFVWTDHRKPAVHSLAWDYDIVITTFNRLSAEWGSWRRSVLMQVHWLRLILDEGHTLGSSLSLTNKLQMAISMTASSRWILTGTPTPNTPNSHVSHLHPMLKFLHEEAYGQNQESWDNGILRPFESEMEEGRSRLVQLLRRIMISARKSDLKTIPPCIKKATFLDFTREHGKSYNELVATVRRNILLADWNDPTHVESLLNPKQWKLRSNTIRNVRLSCCVSGHIKVTDVGEDIQETLDALVQMGLDPLSEEYGSIKYVLLNGDNCLRCGDWCRLPIITPCRHILCLDCVSLSSEKCTFPGCENPYEMQRPELLARPENPNPKWPVPKDLIELQPSYKQDNWNPDWQATSSSKVAYLIDRLKELREANKKFICTSEEEIYYGKTASYKLHWESNCSRPQKVIIFSQFLEHIHVIEQQMTIAGIIFAGMYSPMHSSNKMKSLSIFQNDANCLALLMDGSAALGLDLSFVTHVFLMEPIWDRSMEEQVISRAHRMGAVRPIHVETLAMRGTIEEQMMNFLQNGDGWRNVLKQGIGDYEETRAHRTLHDFAGSNYLARLSSVRVKCD